ncbi:MAG: hypothetical protein ABF689_15260 [Gluconobacter cerinus]|uniref:hypothetical protein n=1 Tax=Gluconobacter cerinus TaxID=38307 RepID=UPI0039ECBE77
MALSKTVTLGNGTSATYWAIASMQYVPAVGTWNVYLGGYVSSDTYAAGKDPLSTRYFVVQKTALGVTPETSTVTQNEEAIYAAILTVVNGDTSDTLNGAVSA